MRKKDKAKKEQIIQFANQFFDTNGIKPTVREIANGTGIAISTVHRYLTEMNEENVIVYSGRHSVNTSRITMEQIHHSMPVLGYVSCGGGEEEVEEIIEYIRLPESLVGRGTFFALIAKGESMIDAGINPGDYVVVNKEKQHKVGDIVVALFENKSNLKALDYDRVSGRYYLRSCNQDKKRFPDIYPDNLQIQGIAVCVIHKLH